MSANRSRNSVVGKGSVVGMQAGNDHLRLSGAAIKCSSNSRVASGIDAHLDWGALEFLTKQLQVGLVGYFYEQLTADGGCAPVLCPFIGVGPQIRYLFSVAGMQGYLNLKGYGEFNNENRSAGWNV